MGKTKASLPDGFAGQLNEYLWHLVRAQGGDISGRWLAKATDGFRSRDYWEGILKNEKAMYTSDIAAIAAVFGATPYEFVRDARSFDAEAAAPVVDISELAQRDYGLAAYDNPNWQSQQEADNE